MYKKFLSFILTVSLFISTSVFKINSITYTTGAKQIKLTNELEVEMQNVSGEELIEIYIWLNDIDHQKIESEIEKNTGVSEKLFITQNYDVLKNNYTYETSDGQSLFFEEGIEIFDESKLNEFLKNSQNERLELSKNIDSYIIEKRELSCVEYFSQSEKFIEQNLKDANIIYISSYAPMIVCELTKNEIEKISKLETVMRVSKYSNHIPQDFGDLNISLPSISADVTKNQGITGNYVKIGQIEGGTSETHIDVLSGKDIIRRTGARMTEHGSLVASIMVGTNGLVPDATLYSTSAYYDVSTNTNVNSVDYTDVIEYENIEWLISQGVTVINRSFGAYGDGSYDDFSKWVDYIVNHHNVTFVQSSGNGGEEHPYVASQAYNAIVVGAISDMGTVSTVDDVYWAQTSCQSVLNSKPDVVAPGEGFMVPGSPYLGLQSGTSYAAPHVTGVIAQMMCTVPALKLRPDAIKAAVVASCDRKTAPSYYQNTLSPQEGAGVVNALKAVNSLSQLCLQETYYTIDSDLIVYDFYPLTTGVKTIAVSWLINADTTGTNDYYVNVSPLTNFEMCVYDYTGYMMTYYSGSQNNLHYFMFEATTTAKYTVEICRRNNYSVTDRISIAISR